MQPAWSGSSADCLCVGLSWPLCICFCLALAVTLLFEVLAQGRGAFGAGSFADFGQVLVGDDALLTIEVPLAAALGALHLFPFLPEAVAWVCLWWLRKGLIDALGVDEVLEGLFIDSFVGVDPAFEAFEVASGLSKLVR